MRTQAIDYAASGILRRRFVRALFSSGLVLLAIIYCLIPIAAVIALTQVEQNLDLTIIAPQLAPAPIVVILLLAFAVLVVTIVERLHRRLIAAVAALFLLFLFLLYASGVAVHVLVVLGVHQSASDLTYFDLNRPMNFALSFAAIVLSAFITLEALVWAVWQMTAGREGFLAARGWRPPASHVLGTFRSALGLPPFLAQFRKRAGRVTLAFVLVAIANAGLAAAVLAPFAALQQPNSSPESDRILLAFSLFLVGFVALAVLGGGAWASRIAARSATRVYQDVRTWDDRPPVMFLRTFAQDRAPLPSPTGDPLLKIAGGVARRRTLDEILIENAGAYGPLVAIGDPADDIPPLGAARIYVREHEDEAWQSVVSDLTRSAKAIVLCPSPTEGVRWEIDHLTQTAALDRIIFLANPDVSEAETERLFTSVFRTQPPSMNKRRLIAAFTDGAEGPRALFAKRLSEPSYIVALNMALQAKFGIQGVPLIRRKRERIS